MCAPRYRRVESEVILILTRTIRTMSARHSNDLLCPLADSSPSVGSIELYLCLGIGIARRLGRATYLYLGISIAASGCGSLFNRFLKKTSDAVWREDCQSDRYAGAAYRRR